MVGRTFVPTRDGRRIKLRVESVENASHHPRGLGKRARKRWRNQAYVVRFKHGRPSRAGHMDAATPAYGKPYLGINYIISLYGVFPSPT
jgi:hypothetical protein